MKTMLSTEYVLLGILMSGPKHGYEILQFLDTFMEIIWHVGASQLYALLKRLEGDGLVYSNLEIQEDRPSKRVFSLTDAGKKSFLVWVNCPTENVRDLRIEFLAKLFFFEQLGLAQGNKLIDTQIGVLNRNMERLQEKYSNETNSYDRLVLEFKMSTITAWLSWLYQMAKPFINHIHNNG